MSLINDALKEMDRDSATQSGSAMAHNWSKSAPVKPTQGTVAMKVALATVVLAGFSGATGWFWLKKEAPQPTAPLTAAAMQTVPTSIATPAQPVSETVTTAGPAAKTETALSDWNKTDAPADTETVVRSQPVRLATSRHVRHAEKSRTEPQAKPLLPAAAPEPPVEMRYNLMNQALAANDLTAAKEQLMGIQRAVPSDSLAAMRARAWYLSHTEDTAAAQRAYQSILDRLPGDENAGLNLAIIEAREGRIDAARALLTEVVSTNPESDAAKKELQRLNESSR